MFKLFLTLKCTLVFRAIFVYIYLKEWERQSKNTDYVGESEDNIAGVVFLLASEIISLVSIAAPTMGASSRSFCLHPSHHCRGTWIGVAHVSTSEFFFPMGSRDCVEVVNTALLLTSCLVGPEIYS